MITAEEKKFILTNAYIPEHVVGLMSRVSGGEPFLVDNYFCCLKENWVVFVGYPLYHDFSIRKFETVIDKIKKRFNPKYISLIAPELPVSLSASCEERESDHYYTLNIHNLTVKSALRRTVRKAMEQLTVERTNEILAAHKELMHEFIERAKPPPRVRNLLFKMSKYVGSSEDSLILNAWNKENKLAAFYVIDLAAKDFSTYVIGCHSKKNYVPGASDLLFFEMIEASREFKRNYIHLGLGVNKGIRRFKKKWGGTPTHSYEMCELVLRKPSMHDAVLGIRQMLRNT